MRRLLVKFSKRGYAVYLSHRETMRSLERALRRAGLPMIYSEGFNPRPRMSFSPALPLGVAAENEYLEVAVEGEVDAGAVRGRLNGYLPVGLEVNEVLLMPQNMPKLSRWVLYGLYRVAEGDGGLLLLSLGGERQGRLRDAMEAMAARTGMEMRGGGVTRVGLFASRDEACEEAEGTVYYYDGGSERLEILAPEKG